MKRAPDPWWLRLVDRLYAVLLHLYPRDFRQAWGDPMRQALRDRCREHAQARRSPARWLCAELLPDFASSVGREQWTTFQEDTTMKRMSVLTMLLLGSVALLWWSQASSFGSRWLFMGAEWIRDQERRALESAFVDYRVDVVRTALASASADERAVAPLFAQMQGPWTTDPVVDLLPRDVQAQLVVSTAAGRHNRLGSFLSAASCRDPAALARLQAVEPDNGAVWALTVTCRRQAGDTVGARAAMRRLARSPRYDSRSGALLLALTEVSSRKPLPPELESELHVPYTGLSTMLWLAHAPERVGLHAMCQSALLDGGHAGLQDDCRAAYAMLGAHADSEWLRRLGRGAIARADGYSLKSTEPAPFQQRLDVRVRAWQQLPADRRSALAVSGLDERALLAQSGNWISPL